MKYIHSMIVLMLILINTTFSMAQISNDSTYREPMPSLAIVFDPQKMIDGYSFQVAFQIYDTLFEIDDFLQVQPHLVSTWQILDEGEKYLINLKPGVRFHNGSTLTTDDIIFTIERFIKRYPKRYQELTYISGVDKYLSGGSKRIEGLKKLSDLSLEISLIEPVNTLPLVLTSPNLSILPNKLTGRPEGSFFAMPIGTGAFKVLKFAENKYLELQKFDDYFLGVSKLDKVVYEFATKQDAINGFNKGLYHDLQWYNPSIEEIKTNYSVTKFPIPSVTVLTFNTKKAPFDKLTNRRFISSKIDKNKLFKECFSNNTEAKGFIPYGFGGHNPIQNPTGGVDQLAADHAKLNEFTILRMENHPCHDKFDKLLKEMFNGTGVKEKVLYITYQDFITNYNPTKNYDMVELTFYPDYPEALSLLDYYRTGSDNNYSGYSSTKYDSLIKIAMTATDKQERYKIYKNAEQILYNDAVMIPVYYNVESIVFNKAVKGIKNPSLMLSMLPMRHIYFEE